MNAPTQSKNDPTEQTTLTAPAPQPADVAAPVLNLARAPSIPFDPVTAETVIKAATDLTRESERGLGNLAVALKALYRMGEKAQTPDIQNAVFSLAGQFSLGTAKSDFGSDIAGIDSQIAHNLAELLASYNSKESARALFNMSRSSEYHASYWATSHLRENLGRNAAITEELGLRISAHAESELRTHALKILIPENRQEPTKVFESAALIEGITRIASAYQRTPTADVDIARELLVRSNPNADQFIEMLKHARYHRLNTTINETLVTVTNAYGIGASEKGHPLLSRLINVAINPDSPQQPQAAEQLGMLGCKSVYSSLLATTLKGAVSQNSPTAFKNSISRAVNELTTDHPNGYWPLLRYPAYVVGGVAAIATSVFAVAPFVAETQIATGITYLAGLAGTCALGLWGIGASSIVGDPSSRISRENRLKNRNGIF